MDYIWPITVLLDKFFHHIQVTWILCCVINFHFVFFRVNVTVVYPCVDIDNITDSERNQILSETQKHLTDYFRTRTTSNVIAAVNVEQVSKTDIVCLKSYYSIW